jgi:hypothetical protein
MLIYFVPCLFLAAGAVFRKNRIFWYLGLSALCIIAGLRFETGDDYGSYRDAFAVMTYIDSPIEAIFGNVTGFEIGFSALLFALNKLTGQTWILFLLVSILNTYALARFYRLFSSNPALSLLFYYGIIFVSLQMAPMRQAIACAFVMLGFIEYGQGRVRRFGLFVLAASLFHYAAIVVLSYHIYCRFCKTNRARMIALGIAIVLIFGNMLLPQQYSFSRTLISVFADRASVLSAIFSRLSLAQLYLNLPGYASSKLGSPIFLMYLGFAGVVYVRLRKSPMSQNELFAYDLFIHGFLLMALFSDFTVLYDRVKNFNIPALGLIVGVFATRLKSRPLRTSWIGFSMLLSCSALAYVLTSNRVMYIPYYSYLDQISGSADVGIWDSRWQQQHGGVNAVR